MILVLKRDSSAEDIAKLIANLERQNLRVHRSDGAVNTILGLIGDTSRLPEDALKVNKIVENVVRVQAPYKVAGKAFHPENSVIHAGKAENAVKITEGTVTIMAGPCSVESEEQIISIAKSVKSSGAKVLRGGAFKPRTSPYAFQGMGADGIKLLIAARKITGLPIISELMSINQIDLFCDIDIIQVGARNMQNFDLLKELGKCGKPVLLKRGLASTIKELLMSAEYIMAAGNSEVILCERGIRTFDNYTRNTLDVSAVPYLKSETHLPVVIDPSHACGVGWMVGTLSKAAIAAGADGLLIEVHNNPECALCDGEQSITPEEFAELMLQLKRYAELEGKTF